mmetsp:Transcript_20157/g.51028  ORF Transcript_20157/g.51028 Transcript_20157/m.51028 type:complete len:224 (+) Transcript_20157:55-726(+)
MFNEHSVLEGAYLRASPTHSAVSATSRLKRSAWGTAALISPFIHIYSRVATSTSVATSLLSSSTLTILSGVCARVAAAASSDLGPTRRVTWSPCVAARFAARARTADDTPKSTAATTSTRLATSAVRVRSAAFNAEQAPSVAPTDWHAARALQALSYVTPSGPHTGCHSSVQERTAPTTHGAGASCGRSDSSSSTGPADSSPVTTASGDGGCGPGQAAGLYGS